jgi:uncharacterized repeat protein (TIGR01451 family)/LPXTG-motif cell wall-anchored protein
MKRKLMAYVGLLCLFGSILTTPVVALAEEYGETTNVATENTSAAQEIKEEGNISNSLPGLTSQAELENTSQIPESPSEEKSSISEDVESDKQEATHETEIKPGAPNLNNEENLNVDSIELTPNATEYGREDTASFYMSIGLNGASSNTHTATITLSESKYIDMTSVRADDMEGQINKTIEEKDGKIVITYVFEESINGSVMSVPVSYKLIGINKENGREVPIGYPVNIDAVLSDGSIVNNSNTIRQTFATEYISASKYILSDAGEWTQNNISVYAGKEKEAGILSDNLDELEFISFRVLGSSMYRDLEKIVITDTLPKGAIFIKEANPDWEYNASLNTVTTTVIGNGTDEYESPVLKLKFPGLDTNASGTLRNNVTVDGYPKNAESYEPILSNSAKVDFKLSSYPFKGEFKKIISTERNISNRPSSLANEYFYTVRYTNTAGKTMPITEFKYEDYALDEFNTPKVLKYSSVDVKELPENATMKLIGVLTDDSEEELATGIKKGDKIPLSNGDKYEKLIITTENATELESNERILVNFGVKFINNEKPLDLNVVNKQLINRAKMEVKTGENVQTAEDSDYYYLVAANSTFVSDKSVVINPVTGPVSVYYVGDKVKYSVGFRFNSGASLTPKGTELEMKMVDLLPKGLILDENSINESTVGYGFDWSHEVIHDYHGTGQTAIVFTSKKFITPEDSDYNKHMTRFQYEVTVGETVEFGQLTNKILVTDLLDNVSPSKPSKDMYDIRENGKEEPIQESSVNINVLPPQQVLFQKEVKGDLNSDFLRAPQVGTSYEEGNVSYQLRVNNQSIQDINKLTIIDNLPYENDTFSNKVGEARGSEFNFILEKGANVPEGYSVFYSVKRFEGQNLSNVNDSSWTAVPSDFSEVKSIKIVMDTDIIKKGEERLFIIEGKIPQKAKIGQKQFNSYAASINGNQTFVDSNKVGLEIIEDPTKPNLELTKEVDKQEAAIGDELTYTIKATNSGTADWKGTLTDNLPTDYVSYNKESTTINGTAVSDVKAVWSEGKLSHDATIKAGEDLTITFKVTVKQEAVNQTIENIATATPEKPITPPVVTPPTETEVPGEAKLELTKEVDKQEAAIGDELTYTIKATNSGTADWKGTLTDNLPTDYVSYNKESTTINGTAVSDAKAVWSEGKLSHDATIKAGEDLTITFKVTVKQEAVNQTIENIATATPEKPVTPPVVTPPTETKIPGKVKPELPKDPKTKEPEKGILPKTGEIAAIWMTELGTVMLCLAGYFIYRKRQ